MVLKWRINRVVGVPYLGKDIEGVLHLGRNILKPEDEIPAHKGSYGSGQPNARPYHQRETREPDLKTALNSVEMVLKWR